MGMLTPNQLRLEETTEEVVNRLFQPDTLLAHDYFQTFRRSAPLEPEKLLMLAVLQDAVSTYRLHAFAKAGKKRRLFLDAQRWLWQPANCWPFCFESICDVLELDANHLRAGLTQWKENREKLGPEGKANKKVVTYRPAA